MYLRIGQRGVLVVIVLLALSLLSFIHIPESEAATHEVHMSGFQFSPTPITVEFGDTVEWINDEAIIHQVTIQGAPGGTSPDLSQGEKWSYTFTTAGTFKYRCIYHSSDFDTGMVGVVNVNADMDPPVVTNVGHMPIYPMHSETIEIRATVTDPSGVADVTLFHCYWPAGICLSPQTMNLVGGDVYNSTVGPFPQDAQYIDYYFDVEDGQANSGQTGLYWIYLPNYIDVSMGVEPTSTYTMNSVWVNGSADYGYRNASGSFPNSTTPAAYANVNVSVEGTGTYSLGMTDQNGDYSLKVAMPSIPGSHVLNVSLSNRSILGWNEASVDVQQLKISQTPVLSKTVAYPDEAIWVNGTAIYNNGSKVKSSNVTIDIDGQKWYGLTGSTGYYSITANAPSTVGPYDVNVIVTNQTVFVSNATILGLLVTDIPVPDISISSGDIIISDPFPIVDRDLTINVTIHNTGTEDALDFFVDVMVNFALVHQEHVVSLGQGMTYSFGFIWNTSTSGDYDILVLSDPSNTLVEAVENNNNASKSIFVDSDFDGDGIGDQQDDDDDNDDHPDSSDDFPYDATEWLDTDDDGIGNNMDTDDDGDGYPDWKDRFPLDATEWVDTDGDGIGNNKDPDDDNDGVNDDSDVFPLDPLEWGDNDGDGIGDNLDWDDDDDGMPDYWEEQHGLYPMNPEDADLDHDGDGLTNIEEYESGTDPKDKDTDDDGAWDSEDFAPTNPNVKVDPKDKATEMMILVVLAAIAASVMIVLLMLTTRRKSKGK